MSLDDLSPSPLQNLSQGAIQNLSLGSIQNPSLGSPGNLSFLASGWRRQIESATQNRSCGDWDPSEQALVDTCSFWLEGVLLVVVGIVGIIGNCLSITVLSLAPMRNTFNNLLIVLACLDNLFLLFSMLDYSLARVFEWPFSFNSEFYALLFPKLLHPLTTSVVTCETYLIVVIAFERFRSVCHPYSYHNRASTRPASYTLALYVLPVMALGVLTNLPKFFETRLVFPSDEEPSWQLSGGALKIEEVARMLEQRVQRVEGKITYEMTDLRYNPDYIRYYTNWTRLLLTCILPLVALVGLNTKIFLGIRNTHIRAGKRGRHETNLALVLSCVVAVFALCHVPRVVIIVSELFIVEDRIHCGSFYSPPTSFLCLTSFNHLLLGINASVNFIIYCSLGTRFKVHLRNFMSGKNSNQSIQSIRCVPRSGDGAIPQPDSGHQSTQIIDHCTAGGASPKITAPPLTPCSEGKDTDHFSRLCPSSGDCGETSPPLTPHCPHSPHSPPNISSVVTAASTNRDLTVGNTSFSIAAAITSSVMAAAKTSSDITARNKSSLITAANKSSEIPAGNPNSVILITNTSCMVTAAKTSSVITADNTRLLVTADMTSSVITADNVLSRPQQQLTPNSPANTSSENTEITEITEIKEIPVAPQPSPPGPPLCPSTTGAIVRNIPHCFALEETEKG